MQLDDLDSEADVQAVSCWNGEVERARDAYKLWECIWSQCIVTRRHVYNTFYELRKVIDRITLRMPSSGRVMQRLQRLVQGMAVARYHTPPPPTD